MVKWIHILLALAVNGLGFRVEAGITTIKNRTLVASYDDATGTFNIAEQATGKAFLVNGKLEGVLGKARTESVTDPVFGHGKRLAVTTDAGVNSLELYDGFPFLLVRGVRQNAGTNQVDV